MAMAVSLQTLDHFSGGGGTAPEFYIIMVAAPEDISYGCILLCACLGVLYFLVAVWRFRQTAGKPSHPINPYV